MHDKFGRVFVRANGTGEWALVEGLQFSNLELRILSNNQVNTSYDEKSFSLDFSGHRLNAPVLLGSNPLVDPEHAMVTFERMWIAAQEMGLINKDKDEAKYQQKCELMKEKSIHILLALVTAGTNISKHDDFLSKASVLVCLEDVEERFGDFQCCEKVKKSPPKKLCQASNTKELLSYKSFSQLAFIMSEALTASDERTAELTTLLEDPQKLSNYLEEQNWGDKPNSAKTLDSVRDNFKFFLYIRNAVMETGNRNGCSGNELLSLMANVLQAFALESSEDWQKIVGCQRCNSSATSPIPSMVTNLKRATLCGHLYLEGILFQKGINIEERVRQTKVFKMICEQVDVHFQKVNDLLCFDKEMTSGGNEWRSNEACILHKMSGLSVEQVKEQVAKEANVSLEQIIVLSTQLLEMWKKGSDEKKQVARFIGTVLQLLLGHLQFYAISPCYFDNMVMDCYLEG